MKVDLLACDAYLYFIERRLLHWSNIVGASHSKNYMVWQYGDYATKGVKEVCEFGYPRTTEQEIQSHVGIVLQVNFVLIAYLLNTVLSLSLPCAPMLFLLLAFE